MFKTIRNAARRLLDHELGVVGGEIDTLESRLLDLQEQHEGLKRRFDLLQNRVGMRLKRMPREEYDRQRDEYSDDERSIIESLRGGRDPFAH